MKTENQESILEQWQHKFDLIVRERNYWRKKAIDAKSELSDLTPSIEKLKDQIYNLTKNK
tara:strand:- start:518 stop:697 length:180 start_codon:yes stop_codon:yes gene_type:complete